MNNITIIRGDDGFGSQFMSILSGIAYAKRHGLNYLHSKINNIKLLNTTEFYNQELDESNNIINNIVLNLGMDFFKNESSVSVFPFFHYEIYKNGVEKYYNDDFLKLLQKSHNFKSPAYYENGKHNIAIHIRRGDDITNESDIKCRIINDKIYINLIKIIKSRYPNSIIHIFSWNNYFDYGNDVQYHISKNPSIFLDDFCGLVNADILIVGSSTFSISAGMLNKNIVICNNNLCKLDFTPIPIQWIINYKKYLEE